MQLAYSKILNLVKVHIILDIGIVLRDAETSLPFFGLLPHTGVLRRKKKKKSMEEMYIFQNPTDRFG